MAEQAPQAAETTDLVDEALSELGRQARDLNACSICWADVRPELRDRHLNWHASLAREFERERLPQVYGGLRIPPAQPTYAEAIAPHIHEWVAAPRRMHEEAASEFCRVCSKVREVTP